MQIHGELGICAIPLILPTASFRSDATRSRGVQMISPEGNHKDINFMDKALSRFTKVAFALLATSAAVAAYGSNPVADEKIAVAKASLERAENSGAPQAAPVELATAKDKLA